MELTEPKLKTYDDYAKMPEGTSCQLIGGEIIMSPTPDLFHQDIVGNFYVELRLFVDAGKLGKVFIAPTDVYFSEHETFQPDILFVSTERLHILKETRIEGAPDLIVEVLSPGTGYYDLANKKDVYEQSGVKEYWIVDPKVKSIEVLTNQNGSYVTFAKAKKSGTVASKLLSGFQMDLTSVFERK
jgi:Uma2 family endonuclease